MKKSKSIQKTNVLEQLKEVFNHEDSSKDIENKLELMKYTTQIQSRLKKHVSSDFILARLSYEDKKGIINMVANAYMVKRLLLNKINKGYIWKWNKDKQVWKKIRYIDDEIIKNSLVKIVNTIFDTIMIKVNMTAILNRNVSKNYLLRLLSGFEEEMETGSELQEKMADILEGKKEK